jgi:hypothetical protein
MRRIQQTFGQLPAPRRGALALAMVGAAALALGGCKYELAGFGCKKINGDVLQVAPGQSCKFRYDEGDIAKYVVEVTRQPYYGEASGEGKYLRYVAKPGFTGEDQLTIKVVRRGVGHVQWQTRRVTVKVGTGA